MTIAPLFQLLFQDTPPLQQHSGAASKGISATNVSPIPFQLNAGSQLSENADLPAKIMGLLRDKNVELSSSEEIVLRNIVSTKVAVYELRLSRAEETIQELSRNWESARFGLRCDIVQIWFLNAMR